MKTFVNGPAAGKRLFLRHAPQFLRVVVDRKGKVDALDAPGDSPAADEKLYAYRLERVEDVGGLVCIRGKGGSHSYSKIWHYAMCDLQPCQEVMQSSMDFAEWCRG